MSTFGGVMEEFPDLRVDYFRQIRTKAGQKPVPPALACFLSHVHSDHVQGLEATSFRGPFIYCSAATKELLLRLEKYPHRLNFALGILEAHKVHFKHLKNLLKPIPLETPTRIELSPGNEIQVTLFDANHCTGAVMFLFEGHGKAVLYTGDIRSEPWFVNHLSRNPFLIEYTSGLKTLDCIYLDTSNIEDIPFPTKSAGLKELLEKVSKYPLDTIFHFEAWTFGYEEVWMALSKALKSPIHVDRYKYKLYQSLQGDLASTRNNSGPFLAHAGPVLTGFTCGNTPQVGCLTGNTDTRLHSCENGMHCSEVKSEKTVWIRPIITRTNGEEIPEVGVGGGGGDLNQHPDLVIGDSAIVDELMSLFVNTEDDVKRDAKRMFSAGLRTSGGVVSLDGMDFGRDENELPLTQMVKMMAQSISKKQQDGNSADTFKYNGQDLPKVITFPYSRHSSYEELCDLIRAFKPKDIYPCTVDEEGWNQEGISISYLFGHECSSRDFRHDREMKELFPNQSWQPGTPWRHTASLQYSQPQTSPAPTNSPKTPLHKIPAPESFVFPVLQTSTSAVYRRSNPQVRTKTVDIDSIECTVPSETLGKLSPSFNITAASPGSETQSLRRKAILDELGRDTKRPRFNVNGPDSSPTAGPRYDASKPSDAQPALLSYDALQNSHIVDTPESEADWDSESRTSREELTRFDSDDQIQRCALCGSEIWGGKRGFCTGCDEGVHEIPYFEDLDDHLMTHYRPNIVVDEFTDVLLEGEDRKDIVGDYLDDDFSAYDSHDSATDSFYEEYEINSFIDDSPSDPEQELDDDDSPSSNDEKDDYQVKYRELQASHAALASNYHQLEFEFREFRMDIMGSDFEENDNDEEEGDEEGVLIISPREPKVVTTELVLSSFEEQAQKADLSEDRIRLRAQAFEAVDGGGNGRSWHDISLISTTNNHTYPEVEL